jgi:hypothetical protein
MSSPRGCDLLEELVRTLPRVFCSYKNLHGKCVRNDRIASVRTPDLNVY